MWLSKIGLAFASDTYPRVNFLSRLVRVKFEAGHPRDVGQVIKFHFCFAVADFKQKKPAKV